MAAAAPLLPLPEPDGVDVGVADQVYVAHSGRILVCVAALGNVVLSYPPAPSRRAHGGAGRSWMISGGQMRLGTIRTPFRRQSR